MTKRNEQIEGLRGLAIILVMTYHFFFRFQTLFLDREIDEAWNYMGEIGVMFFLIITAVYLPGSSQSCHWIRWFIKRFIRIYPLYFVAITLIYFLLLLLPLPGRGVSFLDYLLNVILVNGFIGRPYVDGAHWYITTLLSCLFIVGFLANKTIKRKRLLAYFLWTLTIIVLFSIKCNTAGMLSKASAALYHLLGGDYSFVVISGLGAEELIEREYKKTSATLCVFALVCFFVVRSAIELGIVVVCIAIVLTCKYGMIKLMANRFFVFIGGASYSVYLFHQNIGYVVILYVSTIIGGYSVWLSSLAVIVSVVIGLLMNRFIGPIFDKKLRNN